MEVCDSLPNLRLVATNTCFVMKTYSTLILSVLHLSAVNLPGGEHRRRSAEDELSMRTYLQEGDLISAEVQNIYSDGAVSLHTR